MLMIQMGKLEIRQDQVEGALADLETVAEKLNSSVTVLFTSTLLIVVVAVSILCILVVFYAP